MSVSAIDDVWKRSKAKGSNLLILLAIADNAHDDGRDAWPSLRHLARKSRMTERACRLILKKLVADGELEIEPNDDGREVGRGYVPPVFYHVLCCQSEAAEEARTRRKHGEKISRKRIRRVDSESSDDQPLIYTDLDPSVEEDVATPEAPHAPKAKTLIDEYHDRFVDRVGVKPKIDGPKDGKILKNLVGIFDEGGRDFVLLCLDQFFAKSADPFYERTGFGLGAFSACFNKLAIIVAKEQRQAASGERQADNRRFYTEIQARAEARAQAVRAAIVAMPEAIRSALRAEAEATAAREYGTFWHGLKPHERETATKSGMVSMLINRVNSTNTVDTVVAAFVGEHTPAPELV